MDTPEQHETPVSPHISVSTEVASGNSEPSNVTVESPNPTASSCTPSPSGSQVKLPKLDLKKFDGEISNWPTFWDAFESSIHNNMKLAAIDKFNYLNSLLMKPASDAISGLSLTATNYEEAVAILKKRFVNKQQIISRHMDILLSINPVNSSQNIDKLRHLYDTLEAHVRSLKSLGVPSDSYGTLLSSIIMNKLPSDLRLVISREVKDEEWQLDRILHVLENELEARERAAVRDVAQSTSEVKSFKRDQPRMKPTTTALLTKATGPTCTYCKMNHASNSCTTVTNVAARKEILKKHGRCFVCLRRGHISRNCPSNIKCFECSGRHHVSICTSGISEGTGAHSVKSAPPTANHEQTSWRVPNDTNENPTALYVGTSTPILLQTATAVVSKPGQPGQCVARLILDSGSQRSYVTTRVREQLNLPTERRQTIAIKTFGSSDEHTQSVDVVQLCVAAENGEEVQLSAFVVPLICDPVQRQYVAKAGNTYAHLKGLNLADHCTGDNDVAVDILVGSDHYWNLVSGRVIRGEDGPTAIHTKLGWVLSGPVNGATQDERQQNNLVTTHVLKSAVKPIDVTNESLDGNLRTFWELESLGIKPKSLYEEFEEKISFENQRYEVHLPWKTPHPILPDNYDLSVKRLTNLLKRLRQDPEVLREYDSVIREQLSKGIVEIVEKPEDGDVGKIHYIPHHAVIRRVKATTKLRVVYDASARTEGASRNDCLYAGPPLAENIFDILLRFRAIRVALTGDVEKAFLMVGMAKEDRDVLRFLWVDDVQKNSPEIVILRFTRVVFGVSSSPFLLNATLKYHIERYKDEDPEFVERFLRAIYVDDLSSGAPESDAGYELYLKSKVRLAEGGFNLRKFVSNSAELRERIQCNESRMSNPVTSENIVEPERMQSSQDVTEQDVTEEDKTYAKSTLGAVEDTTSTEQKVLGVRWNYVNDTFVFEMKEIASLARDIEPTKRNVVSIAARFYDPLGFLSPVILQFKLFFQELCKRKIGWDDRLEGELLKWWQKLVSGLQNMSSFTVLRCYFQGVSERIFSCSLHGFGDASCKAYAAVIYLHITTTNGSYLKFVASKSRVAPVKHESIPRLELLAALVLARLITHVCEALEPEVGIAEMTCWTDSRVTLCWIKGEEREWKQFVQHRVNEIRQLVPATKWKHCRGKNNPADVPSRGMSPSEMSECALWIDGPKWFIEYEETSEEEFDSAQLPE